MASTQEFYKVRGRNPRYSTKLSSFANGMYLTNQVIPEGYSRLMVNYDIDATGSHIRPRAGRKRVQQLDYNSASLGPVSLTDYLYTYNEDADTVIATQDTVLSYGLFTDLANLVNVEGKDYSQYLYVAKMNIKSDDGFYELTATPEDGEPEEVFVSGNITETVLDNFWGLYYSDEQQKFVKISNKNIGYIPARIVQNAFAFNKPFKGPVGRPIITVTNNELYTLTGPALTYNEFPHASELNELYGYTGAKLTKLRIRQSGSSYRAERFTISPRELNPTEAYNRGYNMLHPTPYTFKNNIGGTLSILGIGLYPSKDSTEPIFSPNLGEAISVRIFYSAPNEMEINYKIEELDLGSPNAEYTVLRDWGKTFKAGEDVVFRYTYTPKYAMANLRITVRNADDEKTEYAMVSQIVCNNETYANAKLGTFDLTTSTGLISWQGCLGLYGLPEAPNTIFFSDVEDPSYFPYPYNTISLDNDILAVHNYLDNLIVITVDSIWLLIAGGSIINTVQKRILANISIPEIDALNLVVFKDQIFFKTDTQFYVLKPNKYTSDITDLKNYVNSTAIDNFTHDFQNNTVALLNSVYKKVWQKQTSLKLKQIRFEDFELLDTRSVVKEEDVHYIYTINPILTDGIELGYVNLHFVYNTLTRSWRMYLVAIGKDDTYYNPILYKHKQSGAYYEFIAHSKNDGTSSIIIAEQTDNHLSDNLVNTRWYLTDDYENYTYLDTGNVSLDDSYTKRFREVQFNIMNNEDVTLNFHVDFKVDGRETASATKYDIQHITDPNDPEYGKIFVTPLETVNLEVYGDTIVQDTQYATPYNHSDTDYWRLDLSQFPDLSMATVRFNIQGRGRRGSIQILGTSLKRYELSDMNWVYRIMSGR